MQERFPDAIYYDLLIDNVRKAFKRNPDSFRQALLAKPAGTLVIVDEIQKVPELLDAVHWLMVNRGLHFILSGSSARKLKKSGMRLRYRTSRHLSNLWKPPPFRMER